MSFLKKYYFSATIIILCILTAAASWYRFGYLSDYLVTFEIDCDPEIHSCYIGCDDEECDSIYPYADMERYAAELEKTCGPNVLECEDASQCPAGAYCETYYCDASTEDCYESDLEDI